MSLLMTEAKTLLMKYVKGMHDAMNISFAENKGTNAARNAAIMTATGDYCIILDSDDYFDDNALLTINQTVISHPEYKHFMFAPDDVITTKALWLVAKRKN